MAFMEDLKTDQRTQILVAGMIFFAIAFPVYFAYAASDVDELNLSGPVGNYSVEGTYSYHLLGSGDEYVNDGETADLSVNSDSIASEIEGKNIVGVRATMTFTDDENAPGTCPGQPIDDDVSGHLMHSDLHNTQEVSSGDTVSIMWHNSTIIGTNVSDMSESDIKAMLDNNDEIGFGEHFLQISVDVNKRGCPIPGQEANDNGEQISYTWELISLEYTLTQID
ncbi:MAG: hypothetical protein ACJZ4V_01680 [Candidatus Poseidoniaceae archaeon]